MEKNSFRTSEMLGVDINLSRVFQLLEKKYSSGGKPRLKIGSPTASVDCRSVVEASIKT